ncbi:MAG: DUF1223 domain-containing protein [Alphaproteobacteria bacterium]
MQDFRKLAVLLAMGATIALAGGASRAADKPAASPTVVELFTSQGCSSCPPADALLTKLSKRDDIIALSFHVDYWDYIGWKDVFASADSTARQHAYARALRQRYVYTPEMVVNGAMETVGSHEDSVQSLIAQEAKRARLRVPVAVTEKKEGMLSVSIPAAKFDGTAAVWMFEYDRQHVTNVERGENGGRTLTNSNVVREIRRIGDYSGGALSLEVPVNDTSGQKRDGCAIVVQSDDYGPILGAAAMAVR